MKTRIGFPDLKDMNFQIEWRVCVLRPINEDPCQDLGSWTWRTYVKKTPLPPESSKETKELMKTWALGSLSEIPEARRQWRKVFKILKENYLQPRILDATKLSILIDMSAHRSFCSSKMKEEITKSMRQGFSSLVIQHRGEVKFPKLQHRVVPD